MVCYHFRDLALVGRIDGHTDASLSRRIYLSRDILGGGRVDVRDYDCGSGLGEPETNGFANALAATRHDRHLAVQR